MPQKVASEQGGRRLPAKERRGPQPPEAGRGGKGPFLEPSGGAWPRQDLGSGFLASSTATEHTAVF